MYCTVNDLMTKKKRSFSKLFLGDDVVVAYPKNSVKEIATIMNDIDIQSIPVLDSPWNKKIIGVLQLDKIRFLIE